MMRAALAQALKDAIKGQDKSRISTLRLIQAAIQDRDIANRGVGKESASDDDILAILSKMVKQREESAKMYDEGGRAELAAQERGEIEVIRGFMPRQLGDDEVRSIIAGLIAETGAQGLRDMGKVIGLLKERYPGQLDFAKASGVVKELLK